MRLTVPKHDVLVTILKDSDQRFFILSNEYIDQITYNRYTPI